MTVLTPTSPSPALESPLYQRSDLAAVFLPVQQMLQIDRVTRIEDGHLTAEMDLPHHWVFAQHFPDDPIFPGTLLIEAAGQAVAIWAWNKGLRGKPRLAKVTASFDSPLLPEDGIATFQVFIRQRKNISVSKIGVFAGERRVAEVDLTLVILPE